MAESATLSEALALKQAGRYDEACEAFASARRAAGQEPDGELLREQAETLTWAGRWQEALEPASTELHLRPHSAWALAYKGRILSWQGQWSSALPLLRQALQSNPLQIEAVEALSELHDWSDRPGLALEVLRAYAKASGTVLPSPLATRAAELRHQRSPRAGVLVSRIEDNRDVRSQAHVLRLDLPVSWRSGRLELRAELGRFSYSDPLKSNDLPIAGNARPEDMSGSDLRFGSYWKWKGSFEAELAITRFDVSESPVLGGIASLSWAPRAREDITLSARWSREPERFTTPAILGGIRRDSSAASVLVTAVPRTTMKLDVEALEWSDGNQGHQGSIWGLVELLPTPARSLQVGLAASRLDMEEHRYVLRSATSTRDPFSGLHHYDLEGEFAYWSPLRHDRLQLLLKTSHRFGSNLVASASLSWTMEDKTVMPFLGPEWGVAPQPNPDTLEVGSYTLHDEGPLEYRASVVWTGRAGWSLGLELEHVESIFYDYNAVSLDLSFRPRRGAHP